MREFLREYWLWILAPMVIVAVAVGALILTTEDGDSAPFVYSLF